MGNESRRLDLVRVDGAGGVKARPKCPFLLVGTGRLAAAHRA